jgi:hypothetical protein
LSGQNSSDCEFVVPSGGMRSLVVNAALLDASIITMAMAFIVFFTLVCASKPPIFFWFAPSFSFYYGCLAFGNLSDLNLRLVCLVGFVATLIPCVYDRLVKRFLKDVSLGEYLMGLGGFCAEVERAEVGRSFLAYYLIPSVVSILSVFLLWQFDQVKLLDLNKIYLSAMLVTVSIVYFGSLSAIRLRAKLAELSALGPRRMIKAEYVAFLRVEGRQKRDLVLIFAINVCLVMYLHFSNRQYLHGLLTFPSLGLLQLQQLVWLFIGVPFMRALRFETAMSLVFCVLFLFPFILLLNLAPNFCILLCPAR